MIFDEVDAEAGRFNPPDIFGTRDVKFRHPIRSSLATALLLLVTLAGAADVTPDARLDPGSGSFRFPFVSAGALRNITVWYYRPADAKADAPIVFVLHGEERNASTYRKFWIPFAETQRFVLLVPEFGATDFPGTRGYNLGSRMARDRSLYPESQWAYTAIEKIFDGVREANGFTQPTYDIYGHSAGAQFVHRLLMFNPAARFRVAIAANAGWYLMPDESVAFPHGLRDSGLGRDQLAQAFSRRLVVLLGDADVNPEHASLNRSKGASAQGQHRLERGQTFLERAKRTAASLDVPLAWTLEIVPSVAHTNASMAPYAARYVAGGDHSAAASSAKDQGAVAPDRAESMRR